MTVKQCHYETGLAQYSNYLAAIALLQQYQPYTKLIPNLDRPEESVITIPLPIARLRRPATAQERSTITVTTLPCDVAVLMCDPTWKIKTGVEILVFIHRPQEDFSQLLSRWRQTQVLLDQDYEWLMPLGYQHVLSEGDKTIHPLFVVFDETPERIKQGLRGARLPFVTSVDEEINCQVHGG